MSCLLLAGANQAVLMRIYKRAVKEEEEEEDWKRVAVSIDNNEIANKMQMVSSSNTFKKRERERELLQGYIAGPIVFWITLSSNISCCSSLSTSFIGENQAAFSTFPVFVSLFFQSKHSSFVSVSPLCI